jgi:hypothetical protein
VAAPFFERLTLLKIESHGGDRITLRHRVREYLVFYMGCKAPFVFLAGILTLVGFLMVRRGSTGALAPTFLFGALSSIACLQFVGLLWARAEVVIDRKERIVSYSLWTPIRERQDSVAFAQVECLRLQRSRFGQARVDILRRDGRPLPLGTGPAAHAEHLASALAAVLGVPVSPA